MGEGDKWKGIKKIINMFNVYIPTSHKKCNDYELKICSDINYKTWKNNTDSWNNWNVGGCYNQRAFQLNSEGSEFRDQRSLDCIHNIRKQKRVYIWNKYLDWKTRKMFARVSKFFSVFWMMNQAAWHWITIGTSLFIYH